MPWRSTWKARPNCGSLNREGQEDQLGALGLVLNVTVLWNTIYIEAALEQLRQEKHPQYNRRKQVRQLTMAGLGFPENIVYFRSDFFGPTDTDLDLERLFFAARWLVFSFGVLIQF